MVMLVKILAEQGHTSVCSEFSIFFFPWLFPFLGYRVFLRGHLGLKREGKHIPGLLEYFLEENRKADRNRGKAVLYLVGISGSLNMGHTQCMIY